MKSWYLIHITGPFTRGFSPLTVLSFLFLISSSAAQENATPPQADAQRIYRQAYEAAMADSIISPDEQQMLQAAN